MSLEINDSNIDKIIEDSKDRLLIIDFWADWCTPCKSLAPVIDEISKETDASKVTVGKVNVDESYGVSTKYGIRNLPTILFIKNGKVVDKQVGFTSKNELIKKAELHG